MVLRGSPALRTGVREARLRTARSGVPRASAAACVTSSAWCRFLYGPEGSGQVAAGGAWPSRRRTSSTASSGGCRCASGCSPCRTASATAWRFDRALCRAVLGVVVRARLVSPPRPARRHQRRPQRHGHRGAAVRERLGFHHFAYRSRVMLLEACRVGARGHDDGDLPPVAVRCPTRRAARAGGSSRRGPIDVQPEHSDARESWSLAFCLWMSKRSGSTKTAGSRFAERARSASAAGPAST